AAGDIVRGDEAGELAGGGVAVHSDDGDVRIVERLDGGGDGVGVGGVDDHQGVALGDGVGELVGLGGGVVGGVLHVEADALRLGLRLGALDELDEEGVGLGGDGEHDALAAASLPVAAAVAGGQARAGHGGGAEGEQAATAGHGLGDGD